MKQRLAAPSDVIDLAGVAGMGGIEAGQGVVSIGAGVRHAEVAGSPAVRGVLPALSALAGGIGDRQVRHLGTLGGSVANSDPAADYPAAVVGLGATIETHCRRIAADHQIGRDVEPGRRRVPGQLNDPHPLRQGGPGPVVIGPDRPLSRPVVSFRRLCTSSKTAGSIIAGCWPS